MATNHEVGSSILSGRTSFSFTPHDSPDPSLRSGFRLRAPASLTPAKRLKFDSLRAHQLIFIPHYYSVSLPSPVLSPTRSPLAHALNTAHVRFYARAPYYLPNGR